MNILQLCLRFPFPPVDGGTMAMASTAKGLKHIKANLVIGALNTSKHFANAQQVKKAQQEFNIHAFEINNTITPLNTLSNLFSAKAFHVSRFYSGQVEAQIKQLLLENDFDAVVFESLFTAPYLDVVKKHSKAKTILRSHNIEYRIWERVCQQTKNLLKKQYLSIQVNRLKKYELETTAKFDLIAAISQIDLDFYKKCGHDKKSFFLPFGLEPSPIKTSDIQSELKIGHLGSMDWIPNQEGIRWFLKEVLPLVQSKNISYHFAGRHMPLDIQNFNAKGVNIYGEVDSATGFLENLDLVIVPLQSGSGVRIKVLESMASGLPVLATKMGYEGINAQNEVSILEANTAQEFATTIDKVANGQVDLNEISKKALYVIEKEHSPIKAAQLLVSKIENLKGQ